MACNGKLLPVDNLSIYKRQILADKTFVAIESVSNYKDSIGIS